MTKLRGDSIRILYENAKTYTLIFPLVVALAVQTARAGLCDGKSDGIYPHPGSNNRFFVCSGGADFRINCLRGKVFDPNTKVCVRGTGGNINNPPTQQPQTVAPPRTEATSPTQVPKPLTDAQPLPKGAPCRRRVCYFTNWAQYRPTDDTKMFPTDVNASLCTHIIYSFAKLTGNKLAPFEWNDESTDWSVGNYEKATNLKKTNPGLKILIAVGGWNLGSDPFHQMVNTDASRNEFITSTVQFLRQHKFDGLDLDWEFPANRGSPADDKQKFTQLVQELRNAFNQESSSNRLLLTAAVSAGKSIIDSAYEIPAVSANLDWINLMTYDLHGGWENVTGHNSPLYNGSHDSGDNANLNVDWAANYWAQQGAPKDKIVVGMPLYGRSFTLTGSDTGVGAPATPGTAGTYTGEAGYLAYYEVCELISKGASLKYIDDQQVPYLVSGNQWVGYDDDRSLRNKVRYIRDNGFGGSMIWALDLDDFRGHFCGKGKFPLITAIKDECSK